MLETTQSSQRPAEPGRPGRPATRARRRRFRRTRIALLVLLALVVLGLPWEVSYARAMSHRGSDSLSVASVEWLRGNGFAGLVNDVENWWYSHHPPPVGGQPRSWPVAPAAGAVVQPAGHRPAHGQFLAGAPPAPIKPFVAEPLPGEGVFHPFGRTWHGQPTMYEAFLRPDAIHTSLIAGVAWMNEKLLRMSLIPGLEEPGGGPWPQGGQIPLSQREALVATFNSAFRIEATQGGFYQDGQLVRPLVPGIASLVIYKDGRATVADWGRDVRMSPAIATVRQNLHLLVDHGQVNPTVAGNDPYLWGFTLGNNVLVWRSGLGVDKHGNLIYVAGPGLSVQSLAELLQRAHAVRAMELDINTYWVSFFSYRLAPGNPQVVVGHSLLGTMVRPADRYLVPDTRDFVTVQLR